MKELSIEEKAKRYDLAIETAKCIYNNMKEGGNFGGMEDLEEIFPELTECEDERIRKALIQLVNQCSEELLHPENTRQMLVWLEKQGEPTEINPSEFESQLNRLLKRFESLPKEDLASSLSFYLNVVQNDGTYKEEEQGKQKPIIEMKSAEESLGIDSETYSKIVDECIYGEQKLTDKVESNFHRGDFITDGERIFQIKETIWERNNRNDGNTYCESLIVNLRDGITYANNTDLKEYHLWTIEDAKDGDVLACGNDIVIFKENSYNPKDRSGCMFVYCSCNNFYEIGGINPTDYKPATKEQRDLLFSKIKDAGYKWDAEKKELKKIEQKPTDEEMKETLRTEYEKGRADIIAEMQKSAWSEEDKTMVEDIIEAIDTQYAVTDYNEMVNWLKSLKEKVLQQLKQKWKQENTCDLTDFENAMMHIGGSFFGDNAGLDPNDTNAIKEQANLLLELIPNKEWSKEDEFNYDRLKNFLEVKEHEADSSLYQQEVHKTLDWLKSLKDRVGCEANCTTTKEWSEEDEQYLLVCKNALAKYQITNKWDANIISRWLEGKLKSLKDRYTWKPSDEQINALEYYIYSTSPTATITKGTIYGNLMVELLEQLKKLREK